MKRQIEHNYDFIYKALASDDLVWTRWQVICESDFSTATADDAVVTFDIANYTGGAIDGSWTDADFQAVHAKLAEITAMWAGHMSDSHHFSKVKAYIMTFNPDWAGSDPTSDKHPFAHSGSPAYEGLISGVGTATLHLPPQVSFSVTEEVPVRRAWGRFYLPWPGGNVLTAGSDRWSAGVVDAVVNSIVGTYSDMAGQEFYPVIPHTYSSKARVAAWSQVTAIHADDVPDVIRRRRHKFVSYKHSGPTGVAQQPSSTAA